MSEQANSDRLRGSATERDGGAGEPQQPRNYGRRAVMLGAAAAGVGAAAGLAAAPAGAQASGKSVESDESRGEAFRTVVGGALESASTASLISALVQTREFAGPLTIQPSVITLKTKGGKVQVKVSTLTSNSSSTAELVSGGKVIDPAPSGTFELADGKTLTLKKGRLVGGTAATGGEALRNWAVFALMPASMAGEI